MAIEIVWLWFF